MAVSVSHGTDDVRSSSGKNTINLDIPTIKAYINAMISQMKGRITLDTIRPLHQFMGVSGHAFCFSPEAFTPPVKKIDKTTTEKFKSRLRLNFVFFLSNYALVAAGVALVTAMMHPGMLISIGVLWALWGFHTFLISNEIIVFGKNIGSLVSITHRSAFLTALSILVVVWKCLKPAITAVAISGILILSHAVMRDPKHISESSPYEGRSSSAFGSNTKDSDDESGTSDSEVLVERPQIRRDVA